MIRVRIEMVPFGDERRCREIGRMIIHNVGGTAKRGDYKVAVARRDGETSTRAILSDPVRRGEVKNYPRLSYNVWRLVSRALRSAFPEEK